MLYRVNKAQKKFPIYEAITTKDRTTNSFSLWVDITAKNNKRLA